MIRLEALHRRGFLHCDVKPNNIVFGPKKKAKTFFLIDFGLTTRYLDRYSQTHITGEFLTKRKMYGTTTFASRNTHLGATQSRRDDLESLLYTMVYLATGDLPWLRKKGKEVGLMKVQLNPGQVCKNLPPAFTKILKYVRSLRFQEKPDYQFLLVQIKSAKLQSSPEYQLPKRNVHSEIELADSSSN
jgi:serine/threonine protein kinase